MATNGMGLSETSAEICQSLSAGSTDDYWENVATCSACKQHPECGFCMATLRCTWGDRLGPLDGTMCADEWLFGNDECQVAPIASR